MEILKDWLHRSISLSPGLQANLLSSVIAILILWLLYRLILKILFRQKEDPRVLYKWRKTSAYIAVAFGILWVGRIWFEGVQAISTFLGLLSAGLAIALKDPIVNLAGWAFILWRRPFEAGDRIQFGGHAGDVIDQRIFQFTLMEIGNWVDGDQSTGRIIHVPNGRIFTDVQANYTKGFQYIWDELPVLVTFESNWEKAKKILEEIANRHTEHLSRSAEQRVKQAARKFMIFYTKLTPIVYTSVRDSGVLLTIRYLCEPRQRRGSQQAVWEDVLRAFAQCEDIDFAYPTCRFYNNLSEGKPGTKPSAITGDKS